VRSKFSSLKVNPLEEEGKEENGTPYKKVTQHIKSSPKNIQMNF
jgi:hypothetical protein